MREYEKLLIILLVTALAGNAVYAQSAKALRKEREAISKMSKSELNDKATKTARKEAKTLKKRGGPLFRELFL